MNFTILLELNNLDSVQQILTLFINEIKPVL